MNKLIVTGNLVRDPESHTTQDGKNVCNFTVAVNRRRKVPGQPEADFFRVAAWGKMGENCQKYLAKGKKVGVTGPVSVSTYDAKDGTTKANMEVFAEDVEFLGGTNASESAGTASSGASGAEGYTQVEGEELPF